MKAAHAIVSWLVVALTAVTALAPAARAADAWPSQPIRIVVPFGPGSGTDTATRVLAQHLQAALKQTVTVENRAGANGSIAANGRARRA